MNRLILLVMFGICIVASGCAGGQGAAPQSSVAPLALATPTQTKPSLITKISDFGGKSVEGGIAVNPVTHKAYLIAELAAEGSDDDKAVFVFNGKLGATTYSPKVIRIANENEYIAIDSTRNLIYVPTKFDVAEGESDSDGGDGDEGETPGDAPTPAAAAGTTLGTLTVISGNTDTVLAAYTFDDGIQPEGVAVDAATGIVYVAAKAPEGESAVDDVCNSWAIPIPDVGEPADVECWTSGHIYAFSVNPAASQIITLLKDIPAGDDPESIVFQNGMVYAANEDDGTVTIASAVYPDGTGGLLLTDLPRPPGEPYELGIPPYSLGVFYGTGFPGVSGPNPLACVENKFEADKMAAGGGSAFITDDRSRVAKITGTAVVGMWNIPGATICEAIPNSDGGGANTANNIAFMQKSDGQLLYVVSEQNTVAIFEAATMKLRSTIRIPGALHLDGIAVDGAANRVWLTDEELQAVFVLQGACANGTGVCIR